jgi:hypothetical protein
MSGRTYTYTVWLNGEHTAETLRQRLPFTSAEYLSTMVGVGEVWQFVTELPLLMEQALDCWTAVRTYHLPEEMTR